jgi:hypothetical protein
MPSQLLTLTLDSLTASDYLTWVADPEPPALGNALGSITIDADPLGSTVHLALAWNVPPPPLERAAAVAGFPLIPEVTSVQRPMATAEDHARRARSAGRTSARAGSPARAAHRCASSWRA